MIRASFSCFEDEELTEPDFQILERNNLSLMFDNFNYL